ncbi:MAG: transglutaminase-like domain-containing protein [Planctomycetota bacterium]
MSSSQESRTRQFRLNYGATINNLPADQTVRVWVPIAQSSVWQDIELQSSKLPAKLQQYREKQHENQIGYFEFNSTEATTEFKLAYDVNRKEAHPTKNDQKLNTRQKEAYLQANQMVPIAGKPVELLTGKKLSGNTIEIGQALYEIVESYMTYDKSQPGYGNGDVIWACSSKTGNCTDFHSLFISLARNQGIPARFEIGFPLPADQSKGKIGGYHCWAWFYTEENGWIAVDISEADKHPEMKEYYFGRLTPDRVAFSTGRDIELVPESKNGPLNYFVYPHVEVDGKLWPQKNIELSLGFENLTSK